MSPALFLPGIATNGVHHHISLTCSYAASLGAVTTVSDYEYGPSRSQNTCAEYTVSSILELGNWKTARKMGKSNISILPCSSLEVKSPG